MAVAEAGGADHAEVPEAAHPTAESRPSRRTPWIWGSLGFVLGAVCWHFVGFWSFVSTIVWKGEDEASESRPLPPRQFARYASPQASAALAKNVIYNATACATLQMDRAGGETTLIACPEPQQALRLGNGGGRRGDLLVPSAAVKAPAVAEWQARIEPGSTAAID